MAAPIKALVVLDDSIDLAQVQPSMPAAEAVQLVGVLEGIADSWQVIQEVPSDILIVVCDGCSDKALVLVDGAVRQRPDRPVIVLYTGSPNGFVRRVFDAGADDIVALPESSDRVQFAIEKVLARRQGTRAGAVATAPMICVLGPKGGTGKTLTACNLAVALAATGRKVAIVDLDLQFGDVGLALGLAPSRTVYDLAKSGGSLDADKIDGYLMTHPSGVRLLAAPTRPDQATSIDVTFLRDVYAVLRTSFDFVVIDTPPGFTPEVIASIDSSTHICMVGMLDSLSLKNTKLGLETLELMGYDSDRVRLVLNRADSRVGITHDDVKAIIGRAPDTSVPSDRDVARAVNSGQPLVLSKPRSDVAAAYRSLAHTYVTAVDGKPRGRTRRLFGKKA